MPKGADHEWALKLYKQHETKSEHFVKPRLSQTAFIVRHYADDVIYDCIGFVEKNRDLINEEHLNLLCASEVGISLILKIFLLFLIVPTAHAIRSPDANVMLANVKSVFLRKLVTQCCHDSILTFKPH